MNMIASHRFHVRGRRCEAGVVLPIAMILMFIALFAVLYFVRSASHSQMATVKFTETDSNLMMAERQIGSTLRQWTRTAIGTNGSFSISEAAQSAMTAENTTVEVSASPDTFFPMPVRPDRPWNGSAIDSTRADDLFRAAAATIYPFRVTLNVAGDENTTAVAGAMGIGAQRALFEAEARAIPFSSFSLYGANVSVPTLSSGATLGRAYARNQMQVGSSVSVAGTDTVRPLVAGGGITIAAGAQVQGRNAVLQGPLSTTNNEWLMTARTTTETLAVTGRELPVVLIPPTTITEMTGDQTGPESTDRDFQQLARAAERTVRLDAGSSALTITRASGVPANPREQTSWKLHETPNYTSGKVIRLDYDELNFAPGSGYVVAVYSADPQAIVLLAGVSNLVGDFSLVTNLRVVVAGDLNLSRARAVSIFSPIRLSNVEPWF